MYKNPPEKTKKTCQMLGEPERRLPAAIRFRVSWPKHGLSGNPCFDDMARVVSMT